MSAAATATTTRHVVFEVSGRVLALPAAAVRRVLPLPLLDHPPATPPLLEGVLRYRGQAVPVLRLDRLLGLPPVRPGLYAPLLLAERDGRPLALLAERVFDVAAVAPGALLETDPALSFNGCAAGAFAYGAERATALAPDRLLNAAEGRLLAAFQAMADERLAQWRPSAPAEPAGTPAP